MAAIAHVTEGQVPGPAALDGAMFGGQADVPMASAMIESASIHGPNEVKGATADQIAWRGIEACRTGDWQDGMYWLGLAASAETRGSNLPSLFYAYLGYGVARYQGKKHQGLKLCRHALELEFYQPENYLYLARTYLLLGDRRNANDIIERGLQIDATNEHLVRLRSDLGRRQRTTFPFLARSNPLNRMVGHLRHSLRQPGKRGGSNASRNT